VATFDNVGWGLGTSEYLNEQTVIPVSLLMRKYEISNTKSFYLFKLSLQAPTCTHANYALYDRELDRWIIFEPHGSGRPESQKLLIALSKQIGNVLVPIDYNTLPGPQMVLMGGYCALYGLMMVEEYVKMPQRGP
jgi:hypothetical protein